MKPIIGLILSFFAFSSAFGASSTAPADSSAPDVAFASAKSIRVGSNPTSLRALKDTFPHIKENYRVYQYTPAHTPEHAPSHEYDVLNCKFETPQTLYYETANAAFSGPDGSPLNDLNWIERAGNPSMPSYKWTHDVILNPQAIFVPSKKQLAWRGTSRECLKQEWQVDAEGNWQHMCVEWGEATSFGLNVVLRFSLPTNDLTVYQLSCNMRTSDKNRRLTWGDIKPYLKDALIIEF